MNAGKSSLNAGKLHYVRTALLDIVRKNFEPAGRRSSALNFNSVRFNTLRVRQHRRWFHSRTVSVLPTGVISSPAPTDTY